MEAELSTKVAWSIRQPMTLLPLPVTAINDNPFCLESIPIDRFASMFYFLDLFAVLSQI